MRTRFVFSSLILSITLSPQILFGSKETSRSVLSIRQKFDSEISNLQKNMKASQKIEDKMQALSKAETQIKQLRSQNALQPDPDEIYMDTVMSSLKQIPRKPVFKIDDCESYKVSVRAQFDPIDTAKSDPPVAQTLSILELLCKK